MTYTIAIYDTERRRRRPLSIHAGLSAVDVRELATVYRALGHEPANVLITKDTAQDQAA